MQKSIVFLYASNEQSKSEMMKIFSLTIALKRIKFLGIYVTEYMQGLYTEIYKH